MAADKRGARLGVLAVVAALLFSALGVRLWFLQTVQAEDLQQTVDQTRLRTVQIAPERGRIFDADGRVLADNRGSHTVTVDWAALRDDADRATLFQRLSGWLDMTVAEMEERYDSGTYNRYQPMPLKEDVPENVALALMERIEDFPGVYIRTDWQRVYPYAAVASHVLGYMGAITAEDAAEFEALGYDTSSQGERVGRAGVEQSMEQQLHGQWGEIVYEVDSRNRVVREISRTPAVNGQDVQLSIDLDLQYYAERLLFTQLQARRAFWATNPEIEYPDGTRGPQNRDLAVGTRVHYRSRAGAVLVMNQQTGQVMAMASYPTFDNRWFSAGIDGEKFAQLFPQDVRPDESRLTNRAIQGQYNMGSSFKPFTAYSALATGMLSPEEYYNDQGTYQMSSISEDARARGVRYVFRNANCNGVPCSYGSVNVRTALAVSSDAFFYRLGEMFYTTPGTPFQELVSTLGFGADTGVDLPSELPGTVPTNELKSQLLTNGVLSEDETPNLQPGDLLQMSIGQGLMTATPLQMAVGYSTIANGGQVLTPHVVQDVWAPGTPDSDVVGVADLARGTIVSQTAPQARTVPMPEGVREPIVAGLRQNVTGPGANGRSTTAEELFRDYPATAIQVAGKTGTAQGSPSYPWNDSSAFTAFSMDANAPYTVTAYLEKAGYGSVGAAPVVKCMYLALSGVTPLDAAPIAEPLDITDDVAAHDPPVVSRDCMASTNPGTLVPVD